ncbi:MAG: MXAN_5187 C-terminal domain-containing protein [Polyangiaceae bacterium]
MEPRDVERLLGELETAVDRLRALYEQYFMGYEKIEPTVPRKDVDRRIHVFRKEQIRNTALRFRFQMVLQRYNTYQTHWQRICRQIECGTYKRHLVRAKQRFGGGTPVPPAPTEYEVDVEVEFDPPPVPSPPGISEERVRQIYSQYVDAKRSRNESTAAITYQGVAKMLRESGDQLRQKHGRSVDFQVSVKDGKTVLRPVLK